jgi:site-specific DNA-methyltransferase (adenine-specific)
VGAVSPYYEDDAVTIYHGDCFDILPDLSDIGAVVTDPPYSSGGNYRGDRVKATATKYSGVYRPEFGNDHFDQRAFQMWTEAWMRGVKASCSPSAVIASFIDWRQLPALSDAMQFAGWSWQGVAVWSKGFGRPSPGRFSNAAEYVVWGSNGALVQHESYPPGVFSCSTPSDKQHTAQKPEEVMRWVLQLVTPDALVLDPFMGSGTTLRAAKDRGHKAIGIEVDERYCEIAARRMAQEVLPL